MAGTCMMSSSVLGASRLGSKVSGAPKTQFLSGTYGTHALCERPLVLARASSTGTLTVEMNLFSRFGRVVKSYANSLVSAAEDPEKILEQTVTEMNEDLVKMRQSAAQVMASQKQLENKYKQSQATADDWYKRAQLALEKGDEDLAREALKRKKGFQDNADSLKSQVSAQKEVVEKLISNSRILEQKMQEAKSKKETLKARAQAAKTQQNVNNVMGNLSSSSALSAFERMEEKVNALEAEADAVSQISGADTLTQEFMMLEAGSDVDDELAKMKGALGSGKSEKKAALPEGRKVSDAIESELNELRSKTKDL